MPNSERMELYKLRSDIEDLSECLDQHTKALITLNDRLESIAKHFNIRLNSPLINMNMERGDLKACNIVDADIVRKELGGKYDN